MVSFPPAVGTIQIGFSLRRQAMNLYVCVCVCVCARMSLSLSLSIYIYIYLSLSLALSLSLSIYLSFSLSLSLFLFFELPFVHPPITPPTPTIAWERPDIQHHNCEKHIVSKKFVSFCGNVEYVEYVQEPFSKNASFCGNVEYVECF